MDNRLEINGIEFELRPSSKRKRIAVGMEHSGTCFIAYPLSLSQEKIKLTIGKDINKIVDENTNYLEKLNRINQTVEQEINKLLNR